MIMRKCKCIKECSATKYDYKSCTIEYEYETIKQGEIWQINDDVSMVGIKIKLVSDDLRFVEMPIDYFNEHFEVVVERQDTLNKEIDRLYAKIKDGTIKQNSEELCTYMWLLELRDRRLEDKKISYYRTNVYLNKNEMVHFESSNKDKLIASMKNTLSSNQFKNECISKIIIYALKEIDRLSYKELLDI